MKQVEYDLNRLSFEKDWLVHKKAHEWWYVTGILDDEDGNRYSFQYTLIHAAVGFIRPWVLMLAVTDYREETHYYNQRFRIGTRGIRVTSKEASFDRSRIVRTEEGFCFAGFGDRFTYRLRGRKCKEPVLHGDNGRLQMGTDDPRDTTFYYSCTNIEVVGELELNGVKKSVQGRCWLDKQGGTFNVFREATHWEWFSFRLKDGREIMLFSYPQDQGYNDGTLIESDGSYRRIREYTTRPLRFIESKGMKFSAAWEIVIAGVGTFFVEPIMEGQLNLAYYEELCRVTDLSGEEVGSAFVELLPGVYGNGVRRTGFFRHA